MAWSSHISVSVSAINLLYPKQTFLFILIFIIYLSKHTFYTWNLARKAVNIYILIILRPLHQKKEYLINGRVDLHKLELRVSYQTKRSASRSVYPLRRYNTFMPQTDIIVPLHKQLTLSFNRSSFEYQTRFIFHFTRITYQSS